MLRRVPPVLGASDLKYQIIHFPHKARSDMRPTTDHDPDGATPLISLDNAERTLTTREVAKLLGLAVRSVQLMVDRGELQAWKTPGGHRRISRESVNLWLTQHPGDKGAAPKTTPGTTLLYADAPRRRVTDSRKPTVVLIEDSGHFQGVIKLLLQRSHPQVTLHVASDAVVGLALCGAVRPDVLMVDLLLPGIDGVTLIGSLRSQKHFAGLQLMVVTSLDARQREPYAFALEGIPVVEKKDLTQGLGPVLTQQLALATNTARR